MMVLSQACQSLCYLSDRAALAAASLSAAWSHQSTPFFPKRQGAPSCQVLHGVHQCLVTPRRALYLHAQCPCNVHSHWGSLCYPKTCCFWSTAEEVTNSWGTPGSLGDSLLIAHNDFQCTVVCHLRMLAVFHCCCGCSPQVRADSLLSRNYHLNTEA